MIDRSYLPFQSAREYKDRKMQKWMGFFLSEHSSALADDAIQITYTSDLSFNQKLMLLSQVYANQLTTRITVISKKVVKNYVGTIPTVTTEHVLLRTDHGHENIQLTDIVSIQLIKEVNHGST